MKHLDLFSGIGGFALGLNRAGFETIGFCEIDKYCQKVLKKHWPDVPIYEDIKELPGEGIQADIITGGYPCQPFSVAGQRGGEKDDRHLWPEMYRIIKTIRPRWVIAENVFGHISMGLDTVLSDLEAADYTCWPFVIPACAVRGYHRRDRLWLIANANSVRLSSGQEIARVSRPKKQLQGFLQTDTWAEISEHFADRDTHGIPQRMDRLRGLGNAVVPQIPEIIGRMIMDYKR